MGCSWVFYLSFHFVACKKLCIWVRALVVVFVLMLKLPMQLIGFFIGAVCCSSFRRLIVGVCGGL